MVVSVELYKEVLQITAILSCIYNLDDDGSPRAWTRDEAVITGLMIRAYKLQESILSEICEKRMEIVDILTRCLGESLINLKYLLKHKDDPELFEDYIEYSLRSEKRLFIKIEDNVKASGKELPIEKRMKASILRSFEKAEYDMDKVNEKSYETWGEKGHKKAIDLGMEDIYFVMCGLRSHAIHGNFQDLIRYHLEYKDGYFSPNTNWGHPRPQIVNAIALLSAQVNKDYLDKAIQRYNESEEIGKKLDDMIIRIKIVDELHEQFLNEKNIR